MKPSENIKVYDTVLTRCWFGADGILYSISKPGERTEENYCELFELYAELSDNGNKKFCILADITETRPLPKELREFVARETAKYIKAMALISSSTLGIANGSIFEMLAKTPYLVATFEIREEAVQWLKQQLTLGPSPLDSAK